MAVNLRLSAQWLVLDNSVGAATVFWRSTFRKLQKAQSDPWWRDVEAGVLFTSNFGFTVFAPLDPRVELWIPAPCCGAVTLEGRTRDAGREIYKGIAEPCLGCGEVRVHQSFYEWAPPISPRYSLPSQVEAWASPLLGPLEATLFAPLIAERMDSVFKSKVLVRRNRPDPSLFKLLARVSGEL